MHEWALAEAVVKTVFKVKEKENLKTIENVKIVIGELQEIEEEIFRFALKEILKENNMKIPVEIKKERALLRCRKCGYEWNYQGKNLNQDEKETIHFLPELATAYLKCPRCKSPDFEIVKGRGVWIERIEGTQEER